MISSLAEFPRGVWYASMAVHEIVERFINGILGDVRIWQGDDLICVVGIEPDGPFYGEPLANALDSAIFTSMSEDGAVRDEEALRGRKVLLVDNDIITGSTYRRAVASIKRKTRQLQIGDVKFAVFDDRKDWADFAVTRRRSSASEYFGTSEASRRLRITPDAFIRLCEEGRLPNAVKISGRWKVEARSLEEFAKTYVPYAGRPRKQQV